MKKQINSILISFFLLSASCAQEETTTVCDKVCTKKCSSSLCENIQITTKFDNEAGVIKEIVIGDNPGGISHDLLLDGNYHQNRPFKLYLITTVTNELLVPCEPIAENLMIDSLAVYFTGNKTDCCNVLTQPNIRTSYGCMIDIISIKPKTDK